MESDANEQNIAKEDAVNDSIVTYRFTVRLNPVAYARRLGFDVPDDSVDIVLTDDGGASSGTEQTQDCAEGVSGQIAEDAATVKMGGKVKATLAQCKAANPMTCRYHGTQAVADELEGLLRQHGVNGQVTVDYMSASPSAKGKKMTLSAAVTIKAPASAKKAVNAAMQAFSKLPGVEYVDDASSGGKNTLETGFDIDILDPKAQARWGAGQPPQQQPSTQPPPAAPAPQPKKQPKAAQSQPAPAPVAPPPSTAVAPAPAQPANRLRPPIAPPDPGKWQGMPEADMQFLEEAGTNLAYLAQRVNHNIKKGSPGPGQSGAALNGFKGIDEKRLKNLAKNDAQAAVIAKMYDDAVASEAAGWANEILGGGIAYDETKYNSSDPIPSTGYDKWGFDRNKVSGYTTWKKQKDAFDKWDDPANQRKSVLGGYASVLSSTDPNAPKAAVADMQQANDEMTDIEKTLGILDDAISRETDAGAKAALNDILAEAEGAYYAANKAWESAKGTLASWISKQSVMQGSIAETITALKAVGDKVSPFLENWQDRIDATKKEAGELIARAMGKPASEAHVYDEFAKKNVLSLYDRACNGEVSIGTQCWTQYFLNMLDGKHPVGASLNHYSAVARNCFGASPSDDITPFCQAMEGGPGKFKDWWVGDCTVFVNPRKSVMGINARLYDASYHYGANENGTNLVLMTDANSSVAASNNMTSPLVTQDLTKLSTHDFMSRSNLQRKGGKSSYSGGGNEILIPGGISNDNCLAVKFWGAIPAFTAEQVDTIRKYGIQVYNSSGRLVKI